MKSDKEFYGRAVTDTLDSIVSPKVRDTVLREALTLAGELAVPRRAREFRAFVRGALSETLERALGAELGRSVVAELVRLAEAAPPSSAPPRSPAKGRITSRMRALPRTESAAHANPSDLPERRASVQQHTARSRQASTVPPARVEATNATAPTLPARARGEATSDEPLPNHDESARPRPPLSNDFPKGVARAFGMLSSNPAGVSPKLRKLPVVFVATRDAELVRSFSTWLDPRASVVRVLRLSELLLHVQDSGGRKMVVVVDGQGSPIRVEALAALADELPDSLSVVLWGGTRELTARLSDLFPRVAEWLICTRSHAARRRGRSLRRNRGLALSTSRG
ncbi:MAG: hypothetical protein QM756_22140 [Polyangiaceae bacterium]